VHVCIHSLFALIGYVKKEERARDQISYHSSKNKHNIYTGFAQITKFGREKRPFECG
jgi:hypothetical protein